MKITCLALLRGINVSGQKIIKMDSLQKLFNENGFTNVQTYIQSGNIVFQSTKSNVCELETIISKKITETFGFEVPVLVLEFIEFKEIMELNPYTKQENIDNSNLYITFLSSLPNKTDIEKLQPIPDTNDEFISINKAIYLNIRGRFGKTKLSNNFFENKLKVTVTTRNLKTISELYKLAEKTVTN